MSNINTGSIRDNAQNIFSDLRKMVDAYAKYTKAMADIKTLNQYTPAYIEQKEQEYCEQLNVTVRKGYESIIASLEKLQKAVEKNNKVFDFSDPELANCIALFQNSADKVPDEVMVSIVERFQGNRQALLTLRELAPDWRRGRFDEVLFDVKKEIEAMSDIVERIFYDPKDNITLVSDLQKALRKFAEYSGVKFTDSEVDLGEGYQSLVTMQIRAAFGLGTAD